jgi:hypothetical protein
LNLLFFTGCFEIFAGGNNRGDVDMNVGKTGFGIVRRTR